jgi:hypothetical protein
VSADHDNARRAGTHPDGGTVLKGGDQLTILTSGTCPIPDIRHKGSSEGNSPERSNEDKRAATERVAARSFSGFRASFFPLRTASSRSSCRGGSWLPRLLGGFRPHRFKHLPVFATVFVGKDRVVELPLRQDFGAKRIEKLDEKLVSRDFDDRVVERVVNRVEGFAALFALQDVFEPVEILRRRALRGPVRRLPFEKLRISMSSV